LIKAENPKMTVEISGRSEELIAAELKSGRYASADEVIEAALLEHFSEGGSNYDEVEASLLAAVSEPTVPYRAKELKAMVMREIRRGTDQ
jgi:Arc/MetJ-type ribon-helix-helix transcriptional regulator